MAISDLEKIRQEMKKRGMSTATFKPTGMAPNPNISAPAATTPLGNNLTSRQQGGVGGANNTAGQGATAIEAQGGMAKENFDKNKFLVPEPANSPYRKANSPYRFNIEREALGNAIGPALDVLTGKSDPIKNWLLNRNNPQTTSPVPNQPVTTTAEQNTPVITPTPNQPVRTTLEQNDNVGPVDQTPRQTPLGGPGTFTSEEIRARRLPNVEDVNRPMDNEFKSRGGTFNVLPTRSNSTIEGNVAAIESAIQGERELRTARRAAQWRALPENQRGRPPADVAQYLGINVAPRSDPVMDASASYEAELAARNARVEQRANEFLGSARIKNAMANVKRKDRADVLQQFMRDQQAERESIRKAGTDAYLGQLNAATQAREDATRQRGQSLDYAAAMAATNQRAQSDYLSSQQGMLDLERKVAKDQADIGVDYAKLDLNQRQYLLDQEKARSQAERRSAQTGIEQQNADTRTREESRRAREYAYSMLAKPEFIGASPQVKAQALIEAGIDPATVLGPEEMKAFREFQMQLGNY